MDWETRELERIFEYANQKFLENNLMLLETKVAERTLCGALMLELHESKKNTQYQNYYVDVEYNRNVGGKLKTIKKTIRGVDEEPITINCDLILHSRGQNVVQDNLIALEMKKASARKCEKQSDKNRLECLTKRVTEDVWSYGEQVLPEHVCGYKLGVYYEINYKKRSISIEYYADGSIYNQYMIHF